jgi:hypothetical protein
LILTTAPVISVMLLPEMPTVVPDKAAPASESFSSAPPPFATTSFFPLTSTFAPPTLTSAFEVSVAAG